MLAFTDADQYISTEIVLLQTTIHRNKDMAIWTSTTLQPENLSLDSIKQLSPVPNVRDTCISTSLDGNPELKAHII